MAERATILLHITFFAFSLCIYSSRAYDPVATVFLDVSASIQKTLDVLSYNLHEEASSNSSLVFPSLDSSFSLSLHSRSSIFYSPFENYKSLVLSRLFRDSSRVNSILSQVNSKKATPSSNTLKAPLTSGVSQGSGEYFARIGIGRPVKNYYWVIDTGSDVNWLQCLPCESCYDQSDPIYNPSTSSSYHSISCSSAQCQSLDDPSCNGDSCQYKVSYGDGSSTTGDYVTETLSFGSSGSVSDLSVGCGHDNEGLFVGAAGLIGLGGGRPSLPSQLEAKSFSYCLVDRDSIKSSTLEFNSYSLSNSITTKLIRNTRYATYRYLQLIDMSVGGKRLNIPSSLFAVDFNGQGGTIIDSGTTVTRLKTLAYNALRDEFVKQARNLRRTIIGYEIFDTCYYISSAQTVVPTVSFNFPGNQALTLPPENILIPVDSQGTFCLAFAPIDSLSIIGNIQQQTVRVSYDLVYSLVKFSPKQC